MKYKNDILEVSYIIDMHEFLSSQNKDALFTSNVYYVKLSDNSEWVLKILDDDSSFKAFTEVIGEVAAYQIASSLALDFVPETRLVSYNNHCGSLQRYINNTINIDLYPDLLATDNSNINLLKLFWFITGQWDSSIDNVLFTSNDRPIAIDNANIANIQLVARYGGHHFIKCFYTDLQNTGSIEQPIIIKDTATEVLSQLSANLGEDLPTYIISNLNKLGNENFSFIYFIKDNTVWRNFIDEQQMPKYFVESFDKILLDKFSSISINIFKNLINDLNEYLDDQVFQNLDSNRYEFHDKMNKHFEEVHKGIQSRYKLAANYLENSLTSSCNVDNMPDIIDSFEGFELNNIFIDNDIIGGFQEIL